MMPIPYSNMFRTLVRSICLIAVLAAIPLWHPMSSIASGRIEVDCGPGGCSPDYIALPSDLIWAPGSQLVRTVAIHNSGDDPLSIQAIWTVSKPRPTDIVLEWLNGSHRRLWSGGLDGGEATLGTVPRHAVRLYTFRLQLPASVVSSGHQAFTFSPRLAISAPTTHGVAGTSSQTSKDAIGFPSDTGAALGASYPLPNLSDVPSDVATVAAQTKRLILEARGIHWLPWLILLLEIISLELWSRARRKFLGILTVAAVSAVSICLVATSYLILAGVIVIAFAWAGLIRFTGFCGARPIFAALLQACRVSPA